MSIIFWPCVYGCKFWFGFFVFSWVRCSFSDEPLLRIFPYFVLFSCAFVAPDSARCAHMLAWEHSGCTGHTVQIALLSVCVCVEREGIVLCKLCEAPLHCYCDPCPVDSSPTLIVQLWWTRTEYLKYFQLPLTVMNGLILCLCIREGFELFH